MEENENQTSAPDFSEPAAKFNEDLADLLVGNKDKLPLGLMAKHLLSTSVDLIMNQSAIQTQFIVQEMLAPLFQNTEKESSRILVP